MFLVESEIRDKGGGDDDGDGSGRKQLESLINKMKVSICLFQSWVAIQINFTLVSRFLLPCQSNSLQSFSCHLFLSLLLLC